jgi:hypothetical protein
MNMTEVEELRATVQRQRELLMQARASLKPFANYACSPIGECNCHNCRAVVAIAAIDALEPAEPVKGETL